MIAVLWSIRPEWCEKIATGEKIVELRKKAPRIATPYKSYIYCTAGGKTLYISNYDRMLRLYHKAAHASFQHHTVMNGKVIGEFVCDQIDRYAVCGTDRANMGYRLVDKQLYVWPVPYEDICLTPAEFSEYGQGKELSGVHITELTIYDRPKTIKEMHFSNTTTIPARGIYYPPQSWCYVEDGLP